MILVTGATGFVGSRLVNRLAGSGSEPVRGRREGISDAQRREAVHGDLTKPETLAAAVAGVSTVVHAAAITANLKEPYPGAYRDINETGTHNLMKAARDAGVSRIVLMSGLSARPKRAATWQRGSGWRRAVRNSGVAYVILQPSVLFGDGAKFVAALSRLARISPVLPLLGDPGIRFQPLWIEDLLRILEQAITSEKHLEQALPLGGPEHLTFRQVLETICEAMGVRRLLVPLPLPIAALQARVMTALLPRPPMTPATLELFKYDNATNLDAVPAGFGFEPRGFREHLRAHGVNG